MEWNQCQIVNVLEGESVSVRFFENVTVLSVGLELLVVICVIKSY